MSHRVRFKPWSRRGLDAWMASGSHRDAASELCRRMAARRRRLEIFPESGRRIPEFPDLPHRELVVRPYRVFYRVVDEPVWIVAVWHGARGEPPVPA